MTLPVDSGSAMLASTEIELSYETYQARQHHEVSRAGLLARATRLAPGGRFRYADGSWRVEPYPGHAVVSMVASDRANAALEQALHDAQALLSERMPEPDLLYLLPPASFHQTIANTLSDDRYRRQVVEAGLESEYPARVAAVLEEAGSRAIASAVPMRMIGVSLFGSALGALGVFEETEDFERILTLRDAFYGHPTIAGLGIKRTRPFIGHVTLAYLGRTITDHERHRLVDTVEHITNNVFGHIPAFHLPWAELRAYDHLAEFQPIPGLPVARL